LYNISSDPALLDCADGTDFFKICFLVLSAIEAKQPLAIKLFEKFISFEILALKLKHDNKFHLLLRTYFKLMFEFKKFTINQDRCAMKVGTDGVLLGAWVNIYDDEENILDIGVGTGVISLMLAQRCSFAEIHGVDIEDVAQARENASKSPWNERITFERCKIQEYQPTVEYDLIISNPPYFVDSLLCPDAQRTTARHAQTLPFDELRDAVFRLLAEGGRFAVVLPIVEMERFITICDGHLYPFRRTDVQPVVGGAVKRVLVEFSKLKVVDISKSSIAIETGKRHDYTAEYRALCSDFYLKF